MEGEIIYNTYNQLTAAVAAGLLPKEHAISIDYHRQVARAADPTGWRVYSPYFKTDPDAAWYFHGQKNFSTWDIPKDEPNRSGAAGKKRAGEIAREWVKTTYGYDGPWKKNRSGAYVPAVAQDNFPIRENK